MKRLCRSIPFFPFKVKYASQDLISASADLNPLPAKAFFYPALLILHPATSILNPAIVIFHPAAAILYPAAAILYPAAAILHPATSIFGTATAIRDPADQIAYLYPGNRAPEGKVKLLVQLGGRQVLLPCRSAKAAWSVRKGSVPACGILRGGHRY